MGFWVCRVFTPEAPSQSLSSRPDLPGARHMHGGLRVEGYQGSGLQGLELGVRGFAPKPT